MLISPRNGQSRAMIKTTTSASVAATMAVSSTPRHDSSIAPHRSGYLPRCAMALRNGAPEI
jgi:hypothetical protein